MRFTLCWSVSLCAGGALVAAPEKTAPTKGNRTWAYQTPVRPPLPRVQHSAWVRNPIDAFIAARLEAKGLRPAPEADRQTLIRRVSFDLIGLPPTPEEVESFVNDSAPDAYEKVVDR